MARRQLVPLLNRVLVQKIVPPTQSSGGVLLPESATASKLNAGKVVAVGTGGRSRSGSTIPVSVKEGDTVLLPDYGGTEVKLGEEEFYIYGDDDLLGVLRD